jgi:putative transposase
VEEILFGRGVIVSHEAIRKWCRKFGHAYTNAQRRRRPPHRATRSTKFFWKLLKGCQYILWVLITDKLKSYGAAKRESLPSVEHRQHRYLNNRIFTLTGNKLTKPMATRRRRYGLTTRA